MAFARATDTIRSTAELYRPPRRKLPSVAAQEYLRNDKGAWDPALVPMLIEPLDMLGSRRYQGIVFVGPARSGKTFALLHGSLTYIVTCAPGDTLVTQMSQDAARDFSKTEVDRVIRHSPELASRLSSRSRDDNTFDKFFKSGIFLKLGWPAISQLSSKTLQYVLITDYDRPENRDNVDGEGPIWDLAFKRIETFMSRGKCLAESSPGDELIDANWSPSSPHEAPPVKGILSLYNRGTRARWYWPCLHCGEYFEASPGISIFGVPDFDECVSMVKKDDPAKIAAAFCRVPCPSCGGIHEMAQRTEMSARGKWIHEGETISADGSVSGERRQSNIVSYWQGGVSAAYQRWDALLLKYFQGVLTYVRTGDEQPLKAMTATDLADPYIPRRAAKKRGVEELMARVEEWEYPKFPKGVRFLTAAVDVQGNKFVVSVYGWGVDLECWVIDRYVISSSKRPEGDRYAALDPSAYAEDWLVLEDEVVKKTYHAAWNDSISLPIRLTMCDSGGKAGATQRAYEFWRHMKTIGLGAKFLLVKGTGLMTAPRTQMTWPDTRGRKERGSGAKGDVPVWLLNVNLLKDGVAGDLARDVPGAGFVHIPKWVDREFFSELTSESRDVKGWVKKHGVRNEQFDLHVYNRAACIVLKVESMDWKNPPEWAVEPTGAAVGGVKIRDLAALARALND